MLGDLIIEGSGKISGVRVLPDGKVEASFQGQQKTLGVDGTVVGTYWSMPRPDGTLFGEAAQGQIICTTKDGEVYTYGGQGIAIPKGPGWSSSWRGAIYFQTKSQKLARLNKVAGIFEYEVAENGEWKFKVWEWK